MGVDDALSFLAFLELDRGVMLELRNVWTGVAISFLLSTVRAPTLRGALFGVVFWMIGAGEDAPDGGDSEDGAIFGNNDGLLGESMLATGRPLATGFWFWFWF